MRTCLEPFIISYHIRKSWTEVESRPVRHGAVRSAAATLSTCCASPFCVCCSRLPASEPRALGCSLRPGPFISVPLHEPGGMQGERVYASDFSNNERTHGRINPDPVSFPLTYMFFHCVRAVSRFESLSEKNITVNAALS